MDRYIVGIGEALWDCLPDGREIGGAPANFAYHAGRSGLKALAVSAVGDDPLGRELTEKLAHNGVECVFDVVDYPTGTVQVEVDSHGIPSYDIKENVAWDNIPYTQRHEEIAHNCLAVCFGTLAQRSEVSRNTIRRFIESMPSNEDTYKVFDINLRQHYYSKELIEESLRICNILKINDDELGVLKKMFNYREASDREVCKAFLTDYDLSALILTCGTEGSHVFTINEESYMETPKVDVVDTVGAGDSFTAAFIASLIKGKSMKEAHESAVKVAALVCTRKGAMPLY